MVWSWNLYRWDAVFWTVPLHPQSMSIMYFRQIRQRSCKAASHPMNIWFLGPTQLNAQMKVANHSAERFRIYYYLPWPERQILVIWWNVQNIHKQDSVHCVDHPVEYIGCSQLCKAQWPHHFHLCSWILLPFPFSFFSSRVDWSSSFNTRIYSEECAFLLDTYTYRFLGLNQSVSNK